jgi:hypothetical protein
VFPAQLIAFYLIIKTAPKRHRDFFIFYLHFFRIIGTLIYDHHRHCAKLCSHPNISRSDDTNHCLDDGFGIQ